MKHHVDFSVKKYNFVLFRARKIPSYSLEVETEPEQVKPATEEKPVKKTWTTAMTHTGQS